MVISGVKRKFPIAIGLAGLAVATALGSWAMIFPPRLVERIYSRRLFPTISHIASWFADSIPFSWVDVWILLGVFTVVFSVRRKNWRLPLGLVSAVYLIFFWGWDLRVTGLDVDDAALEKARRAVYHQGSLRTVTPPLLERHFVTQGSGVRVKDSSRRSVSFRAGNLLEPASYEGLAPLDVVFCRNVLIYFFDAAVQRAVSLFHQALAPGGYLFLGHAESLARVSSAFVPIRFQGAIVYQKPEEAAS